MCVGKMGMKIHIKFYYHLKEKAGKASFDLEIDKGSTVQDLKKILERLYPQLRTQLDNVMILMNKMIVLDEDLIKDDAEISFLTPVGGG